MPFLLERNRGMKKRLRKKLAKKVSSSSRKSKKSSAQAKIEKEYRKQRENLRKRIARMQKAGYEDVPPMPSIPKRITQGSINKLKKITRAKLAEKATLTIPETGEVITGKKAESFLKKQASKKGSATRKRRKKAKAENVSRETNQISAEEILPEIDFQKTMFENFLENNLGLNEKTKREGSEMIAEVLEKVAENKGYEYTVELFDEMQINRKITDYQIRYNKDGAGQRYVTELTNELRAKGLISEEEYLKLFDDLDINDTTDYILEE